jgi:hypothetical protein
LGKCYIEAINTSSNKVEPKFKVGDVLISENDYPFIYAGNHIYTKYLTAYCGITNDGEFKISDKTELWTNDNVKPATKEQRDLLFSKMREAGYEWDENKKELRKIEKQGNKTEEYIFRPIAGSTIDNAARQAINKATNGENIVFSFNGFFMKIYKDTTIDNIINSYNDFCKKQCKPKWSEEQQ